MQIDSGLQDFQGIGPDGHIPLLLLTKEKKRGGQEEVRREDRLEGIQMKEVLRRRMDSRVPSMINAGNMMGIYLNY
jgi:hypothetical protein